MKRGLALFLSPMLLVTLIIGCSDDSGSSPTTPTTPPPADSSLTAPTIRAPEQGEQLEELKPELEIGNATGGSGARTYTFEVALDGAFQQIVAVEAGIPRRSWRHHDLASDRNARGCLEVFLARARELGFR